MDVSVANEKAVSPGLSKKNFETSSPAICCASPALPPFPAVKTFLSFWYAQTISSAIF